MEPRLRFSGRKELAIGLIGVILASSGLTHVVYTFFIFQQNDEEFIVIPNGVNDSNLIENFPLLIGHSFLLVMHFFWGIIPFLIYAIFILPRLTNKKKDWGNT